MGDPLARSSKVNIFIFVTRGPSTEKTERTRARILAAAEALLARRGYSGWTMRELAERAACAVGLVYRYFPTRESLVLGLYAELERTVSAAADTLAEDTVGQRFAALVAIKLAALEKKPRVFRALAHAALAPDAGTGVLSEETAHLRDAGVRAFTLVVSRATNAPLDAQPLGRVLYGLHLLIVLIWTQRTQRTQQTERARPPKRGTEDDAVRALVLDLAPLLDLVVAASSTPLFLPMLQRVDALARSILEDAP